MMKKTTILMFSVLAAFGTSAQVSNPTQIEELEARTEKLEKEVSKMKNLKISGYIQGQWQWGEENASLKVGTSNYEEKSFNRLGIRRGRVKFTYDQGIASAVFQLDITEKGVGFKDAYLNLRDPWFKSMQLRAGIFDRPFGFEIGYSSSRRESPERSLIFQTLFPDERDLGAMLVLQAPKSSPWSILKLEAGLFAGNGIKQETDNKKDFIGHLTVGKTFDNIFTFGAGASYYNGRVYQGTADVYKMSDKGFVLNGSSDNLGRFAKREYIGFDAQFTLRTAAGKTQLRGEYLFGKQPGLAGSSKSPNSSSLPGGDTYLRDFQGGYVIFVQDLGPVPVSVVAKYDWYDPNTKVKKNEVGQKGTGKADIAMNTLGFGAFWDIISDLRLTAYYEIVTNEKSENLSGFEKNRKDDLFTLRLQYKF